MEGKDNEKSKNSHAPSVSNVLERILTEITTGICHKAGVRERFDVFYLRLPLSTMPKGFGSAGKA